MFFFVAAGRIHFWISASKPNKARRARSKKAGRRQKRVAVLSNITSFAVSAAVFFVGRRHQARKMTSRAQDIPAGVTCGRKRRRRSNANNDTHRYRRKAVVASGLTFGVALVFIVAPRPAMPMRIPRPWSGESACERAVDPDWPFVYAKYRGQKVCTYVHDACGYRTK